MKNLTQALVVLVLLFQTVNIYGQTIGTYLDKTISSGQNTTIIPSVPPSGAEYLFAFTNVNFSGVLSANPTTGVVYVTNALNPGSYLVTVKAFGADTISTKFTLTVKKPICSDAEFYDNGNLGEFSGPVDIGIGDFNNDGKQDFVTADKSASDYSIGLGNGRGSFSGYFNPPCTVGCQYYYPERGMVVGDLNGDGNHDVLLIQRDSRFGYEHIIKWGNQIHGTKIPAYSYFVDSKIFKKSGDFNNDGFPDLVTTDFRGRTSLFILFGNVAGKPLPGKVIPLDTFISSLETGDFNGDGNLDMAIINTYSNKVSIKLGDGNGNFTNGTDVLFGIKPYYLLIGDFNGDGKQDMATDNGAKSLSIRLGDGHGGFSGNTDIALIANFSEIAIGDFNGDGKRDLAFSHSSIKKVSIYIGDGFGSFNYQNEVIVGSSPYALVIGDFNEDGIQDFATTNSNPGVVNVRLGRHKLAALANLKGNGVNILNADYTPSATDHTDFGIVDTGSSEVRNFSIQNTGETTISIVSIKSNNPHFLISNVPNSIGVAGSAQFSLTFSPVVQSVESDTITILFNDCVGAYQFAVLGKTPPPVLGTYPNATMVTGQNIVITPTAASAYTASATAYTNTDFTGEITVEPTTGNVRVTNAKQAGVYPITVKAFGTDTLTRTFTLTVTNPECSEGLFSIKETFTVGNYPSYIAVGDFNKDSKQDLAIGNAGALTVSIRLGDGLGGFTANDDILVGFYPSSVAIGDFNGDGFQDLAISSFESDNVSIRLGDGLGGFTGSSAFEVGNGPFSVAVGDLNGDGKQDIATSNGYSNNVTVRLGDGNGSFGGISHYPVGTRPFSVVIGDFNGDSKPDLVTTNSNSGNISILIGNGVGVFGAATNINVGISPSSLAIGDFNGDGKQDFAIANQGSNNVFILLGDGVGGFGASTIVSVGAKPSTITIGDFNGDGKQDFACTNQDAQSVSIRLGNGAGGFSGTEMYLIPNAMPLYMAVGDFNGDAIQDFAVTNRESKSVSIVMGNSAGAGTSTWLGISANWQTPENWSSGKVPGSCTRVLVNTGVPFLPVISGINNTCFSLMLNNGATIQMEKDAKLTITGSNEESN